MSGASPTLAVFLAHNQLSKYYDGMVAYGAENVADWMSYDEEQFSTALASPDINMAQGHMLRFAKAIEALKQQGATEALLPALLGALLPALKQHATTAAASIHAAVNHSRAPATTACGEPMDGKDISPESATMTTQRAVSNIFAKAMELNEKYGIAEKVSAGVTAGVEKAKEMDEQYKISDKVSDSLKTGIAAGVAKATELDEKYKIREKIAEKVVETANGAHRPSRSGSSVVIEEMN